MLEDRPAALSSTHAGMFETTLSCFAVFLHYELIFANVASKVAS